MRPVPRLISDKRDSLEQAGISMDVGEKLLQAVADVSGRIRHLEEFAEEQRTRDLHTRVALLEQAREDERRLITLLQRGQEQTKERLDRSPAVPSSSSNLLTQVKDAAPITIPVSAVVVLLELARAWWGIAGG